MFCAARSQSASVRPAATSGPRPSWSPDPTFPSSAFAPLWDACSLPRKTAPAAARPAVLGYDHWKTRFAGDPSIIGREILVNDHKLTIVGVAQPGFQGTERLFPTQIYIPIMMAKEIEGKRLDDRATAGPGLRAQAPGRLPRTTRASLQPIFHSILAWEVLQKEFSRASAYSRSSF